MRKSRLFRTTLSTFALLGVAVASVLANQAVASSGLVSSIDAQRSGLQRAWFSQAQLDRSRHRVEHAVLDGDSLFVLTTAGVLHSMDAETGRTNWIARIGNPDYPSLGPAANDQYVALINGSTLTVLRRDNGVEHLSRELGGGAGGGPALTSEHVYAPLFSGKVEAYSLTDDEDLVWYYSSSGRVFQPATATPESVTWPTQRGFLYVANPEANGVRYRFETNGLVNSHPTSFDGRLFFTTSNGYAYALDEATGQQLWRYSTGSSVSQSPIVVNDKLFVVSDAPALHAASLATGERQWRTGGIDRIASVSESRVYGLNRQSDLVTMDLESGVPLGRLRTSAATTAVVNTANDRIYLISDTGLVQCLHEVGADQPFVHPGAAPADAPADQADAAAPADADQPAEPAEQPAAQPEVVNPFGGGQDADDNPFGGGATDETENPFGF
ncbi:PQQ-binding-like beta-propeller repeat protein [Aeoliella sp. ICT_H6.2]|uniref:PQQ-binding-like beta-propeller repeat protein n=1 Tax=Aeoliella straminimaris TaxID=2954799 RepID=A0A9X2JJ39_9BACT|nr:PQQ-binding-like beta-propeller repeat protein [Aeoliella straminimaris]MCO6047187.1 PQQ-binding-like beta-propeller repeat protein [Aeoliella straminimaris]